MPSRPLCMLAQPDDIEMNGQRPAAGRGGQPLPSVRPGCPRWPGHAVRATV